MTNLTPKKVLYDCDNTMGLPRKEIDDGLTLLYLLGRPDVELMGVTTVFGNGTVDETYNQTKYWLRRLKASAALRSPVAQGHKATAVYKGADESGQGNTEAAHFLAETAAAYPGEIIMLATGPLSNLRAAAELDPMFFRNLRQIACMGGYLRTDGVRPQLRIGWRTLPELNLSADPEAAWCVLNASSPSTTPPNAPTKVGAPTSVGVPTSVGAATCPVTLMNAHVCLQAPFGWRDLHRFKAWHRELHAVIRHWLLAFGVYCGVLVFYLWDLLPAVYISYPELFDMSLVELSSTVQDLETGTLITRTPGGHKGDNMPTKILDPEPSRRSPKVSRPRWGGINMPTEILDSERFKAILFEAWKRGLHTV